jgi:long-chain fatty acid transport protein
MRHLKGSRGWILAGTLLLVPVTSFGAGFALYEHGARAVAMGGAFGATADDPTAVYYNPAGLAFQEGTQLAGGVYFIKPISKMDGANPFPGSGYHADMEDQLYFPPHLYFTGKATDRLAWGVGLYTPFGLGTWWPEDWAGRYITKRVDLKVLNFNPTLAYKITDNFAVGVGFDLFAVDLDLTKTVGLVNPYTQQVADVANAHVYAKQQTGTGWNVGLLAKPGEGWSLGLTYRSKVKVKADGKGSFVQYPTGNADFDAIVAGNLPFDSNPKVTSEITFPEEWRLAVAWTGGPVRIEADAMRVGWHTFHELPIIFPDYPVLSQIRPEDYHDTSTYRLGFEYRVSDRWSWLLGALYDESPLPVQSVSPLLPDADRVGVTAGFSYGVTEKLRLDVGYMHLNTKTRSTQGRDVDNFNGTYSTRAELLGFTLVYAF